MADLHPLVWLALHVAEGRREHPSNAAFGQWVRNDPEVRRLTRGHLGHQDRAALIKIAQLDPEEASVAIRRHGSFARPELLWRDVLRHLPARKTPGSRNEVVERNKRKTPRRRGR